MTNKQEKKSETVRITGRTYDAVVRQLVDKYHSGNGWAVNRIVNKLVSLDVYVERNVDQGFVSQKVLEEYGESFEDAKVATKPVNKKVTTK